MNVLNKQGLGLAGLGLHTNRVTGLGRVTHKMTK